jgi:hypothetical protein
MKKPWNDPAKRPAKESTMNTEGDFGKFTDLMRKVVNIPAKSKTEPESHAIGPARISKNY